MVTLNGSSFQEANEGTSWGADVIYFLVYVLCTYLLRKTHQAVYISEFML